MYRHHQAGVSILRTGRWPICYRRRGPSSGALQLSIGWPGGARGNRRALRAPGDQSTRVPDPEV